MILLTARARNHHVRAGAAAGADAYITKPFSPHDGHVGVRSTVGAGTTFEIRLPVLVAEPRVAVAA